MRGRLAFQNNDERNGRTATQGHALENSSKVAPAASPCNVLASIQGRVLQIDGTAIHWRSIRYASHAQKIAMAKFLSDVVDYFLPNLPNQPHDTTTPFRQIWISAVPSFRSLMTKLAYLFLTDFSVFEEILFVAPVCETLAFLDESFLLG